ncbi:unnamed protein product, partial [Larinioides sclopetarius]
AQFWGTTVARKVRLGRAPVRLLTSGDGFNGIEILFELNCVSLRRLLHKANCTNFLMVVPFDSEFEKR